MSESSASGANYVIEMVFEEDGASALARASAWLTLQGDAVELQTVVGDADVVSLYYVTKVLPAKQVVLPGTTGGLHVVSAGEYTTTNGGLAA